MSRRTEITSRLTEASRHVGGKRDVPFSPTIFFFVRSRMPFKNLFPFCAGLLILLLILTYTAAPAQAQAFAKWISAGKYSKTLDVLTDKLRKSPDDIELNYFLGLLYSMADESIFDEDSSYKYFDRSLQLFTVLRDKKTRGYLSKISVSPSIIRKQMNAMLASSYANARLDGSPEAYLSFFSRFPGARHAVEAQRQYDMILFNRMAAPGLEPVQYMEYLINNPGCACRLALADSLIAISEKDPDPIVLGFLATHFAEHERFYEIYLRLYDIIRSDGELLTLIRFYNTGPNIPLNERQKKDFALAIRAYQIGLTASVPGKTTRMGRRGGQDEKNQELNRRLTREGAQTGDLQFSLMWNNLNDIDLHVVDPFAEEIYFARRRSSSGGILDVDMNVHYKKDRYSDKPVENIFWPHGKAPAGRYKVSVVHYKNHEAPGCNDPTDFTVRVRSHAYDTLISGAISFTRWKAPMTVFEFDYSVPERFSPEFNDSLAARYASYIRDAAPLELAWVALQKLLAPYIRSASWDEAANILSNFAPFFSADRAMNIRFRQLAELLRDDRFPVTKERLANINTDGEEYSPVLSADEKTMYFCGRGRYDNIGKEDIYIAHAAGKAWSKAQPFEYINTATENEAPLSVSTDGTTMLLFRDGDIYFAGRTDSGWSQPEAFPFPVNTGYWEGDAMLTADGRAIIFASNRPGGKNLHTEQNYYHGSSNYASDIYVSEWRNGAWQNPVNLGKTINTMFCERSPFLHADLKTLYFSSDGHYGLGDLDVFLSRRLSDTSWTQWSVPVNLGRSINTADADWGYRISSSGTSAYFSAYNAIAQSKEDMYRITLPPELRPEPVTALTGTLTDFSGNPVRASLRWVDLATGEEAGISGSDPLTGAYYILLPSGRQYGYYAESGTYFSVSGHLDLRDNDQYSVRVEDLTLYRMDDLADGGEALRINNLFFDFDKADLRKESFPELRRLAAIIREYPDIRVQILGHTDDRGTDEYNRKLSESRAQTILQVLVKQGVPADVMTAAGLGKSMPLVPNTSDENRQMNRRVEFRFSR
jgi:outer membrane protein OmpA-like peptidoglycan-associated protein